MGLVLRRPDAVTLSLLSILLPMQYHYRCYHCQYCHHHHHSMQVLRRPAAVTLSVALLSLRYHYWHYHCHYWQHCHHPRYHNCHRIDCHPLYPYCCHCHNCHNCHGCHYLWLGCWVESSSGEARCCAYLLSLSL